MVQFAGLRLDLVREALGCDTEAVRYAADTVLDRLFNTTAGESMQRGVVNMPPHLERKALPTCPPQKTSKPAQR
ncbi:hypothetical protein ABH999_000715 [Bradyrhizobium yuanmingense]|uniref:hypothetical protein n=1 Tax=Bradyrhizobium yuanmingense TaxID=108015 RepID=UPI003510E6C7